MDAIKGIFMKFTITFFSLIAVFVLFSVFVCWLPDRAVKEHVSQIAPVLHEQGIYPQAIIKKEVCQQDNFTDALILNQMFCIDRKSPLKSAMAMQRVEYEPSYDMVASLHRTVCYEQGGWLVSYPRYWHGGTFLFRTLLMFMDYYALQWLLYAVSSLLLALFLCLFYARVGIAKTFAFLFSWLLTYGFVTQFSMQFFPAQMLSLVACILVVRHRDNTPYLAMLFFVIACLTCYLDLLTTPLLTLGWPLIVWVSMQDSAKLRNRDTIVSMMGWCLLWGLGYALTFAAKWCLGSVVLGMNVLKDAADTALYRVGTDDFTRWDAIVQNFKMISWGFVIIVLVVMAVISALRFRSGGAFKAGLLFVLAFMPYIWYFLLSNHSYLHFWFTYRLQAITLAALFMAVLSLHQGDVSNKSYN